MKVLVLGSGGREHALVWKLAQSNRVTSIHCAPGNGGIAKLAQCVNIDVNDKLSLIAYAKKEKMDLVVVGPENPLSSGIVDAFEGIGIPIFGPCQAGAMVETSKIFAKELMDKGSIPTAPFRVFSSYGDAKAYLDSIDPPFVIKADGLCAGKGAYVIKDRAEGNRVLHELMVELIYGEAGRRVVVEQFLSGVEASYLAFTDGITVLPMIPSQDHKTLLDGDKGPNTGGMGAYAPVPFIDSKLGALINEQIMNRAIDTLRKDNVIYKGVLYGGLMIDDGCPYVIEFNARLGDPETQPLIFKMESDILPIILACVEGRLAEIGPITWKPGVTVCVVLASGGYPEKPVMGKVITGLDELKNRDDVIVFHAGTILKGREYVTSGGRVLGITSIGETYEDAINKAYEAVSHIHFEGMQYRTDIGKKALN